MEHGNVELGRQVMSSEDTLIASILEEEAKTEAPALLIERDELEGKLRTNIMEVSFNKISGEKRVMNCTLSVSMLPPPKKDEPLTQKKSRAINEEVHAGVVKVTIIQYVMTLIRVYKQNVHNQRVSQRQVLDC